MTNSLRVKALDYVEHTVFIDQCNVF